MTNDLEPKVWVGCLACYNEGELIGEWIDATEAGDFTTAQLHANANVTIEPRYGDHEELWVMDHEGFGGFLTGECSPDEAQRIAEQIEAIPDYVPAEAVAAYLGDTGDSLDDLEMSDFEESYNGEHDSEKAFAQELADDIGAVDTDIGWPNSCIDWDQAARELFMGDYWSERSSTGTVFVFRRC
jgi:antirestriction protein